MTSLNDLPINSAIQPTIIDAVKKVDDEDASSSICCTHCQEEDDEHNVPFSFVKTVNRLCAMVMLFFTKRTRRPRIIHCCLLTKFQTTRNINSTNTKIDQVEEESLQMTNNADSKQCLEHYNSNKNENLDLSLIADEVIDHVMMPLIDAKVLHYLKCADSKWRPKIEEYAKKSVPMFKFIAKFGSNGSGSGQFKSP
jgi:hypothetical protein